MDIALDLMINEEIRDREVRLIDENGEQLGVMPTAKAMELAVGGMIPNNSIGRAAQTRLHCYAGAEHPHASQKPEVFAL